MIERILHNGQIITLNPQQPRSSALAIAKGRIVALGGDAAMLALADRSTQIEDLRGLCVVPGMADAHIHWMMTARALDMVDLFDVPSLAEALQRVRERAEKTEPGCWILGYGWSQDLWPGRRFPTAADLDSVAPYHPVFLRARSGHAAWVNSLALRAAQIDAATPDPEGGAIMRTANGQPTGILLEGSAIDLAARVTPRTTGDALAEQMRTAQEKALSLGITMLHDLDNQPCLEALLRLRERGQLKLRVLKYFNVQYLEPALTMGLRFGFGDDWLRLGGLKLFADGALGPLTAALLEPYDGQPDNTGIIVTEPDEMLKLISRATLAGFPTAVHAIGDRAIRLVLDVFEQVRRVEAEHGIAREHRRHRIEHVQLIHPNDVGRLAALGIIASMQPIHATSDYPIADRYWGTRVPFAYNPRLQIDHGAIVAFGSDSPYDNMGSFKGIHAAVTRRRPDGSPGQDGWNPAARITAAEALRGYTFGPAYAAGMEDRLGVLAPGYYADLVVIDRDPLAIPSDALGSIGVIATMVGGLWQFGAL